ncbi:Gfo/Idh/MocA family oxidoreductase [Paenibacillus sp.]|uniref:Gfo/Idh/MocA family protein n=1 Tax=Paenibacillus sp. TaxID=58172 RepID=UPI002D71D4D7|nr:Gfo/Idh/MocA family oxidoreductase [Paenibacillus sp.]HZG58429.1 Gfo/Idh/MocA family oxidoreductase [Paenibacillus sp.]
MRAAGERARRFGVYGCQHGHIGIFIDEMLALGHQFIGIHDKEPGAVADAMREKYGVPLFDTPDPLAAAEVIGCAGVNAEKIDAIEWCAERGIPVMVDKPAVTTREGLNRLERILEEGKTTVGMLLTERYRPSVYALKRSIEQGVFGDIVSIGMRKPHRLSPERRPAWFFDKERCGGIIVDLFIHDFDLLRWLTGREVVGVRSRMIKRILPEHPGFWDVAVAEAELDQGVIAQLYADWHTPASSWTWGDGRIFVVGTEGTAELRLEGEPGVSTEDLLITVAGTHGYRRETNVPPPSGIVADFLTAAFEGTDAGITHRDILIASEWTIVADERAEKSDYICTRNA